MASVSMGVYKDCTVPLQWTARTAQCPLLSQLHSAQLDPKSLWLALTRLRSAWLPYEWQLPRSMKVHCGMGMAFRDPSDLINEVVQTKASPYSIWGQFQYLDNGVATQRLICKERP